MNPLEYIYLAGYRYKTRRDLKLQKKLPLPVISVGNITTGGTGKTPCVIAIAREARKRGLKP
ncbi:tetraacyldisaccharide 4'-kinase, partial [Nitrospirota bacterium]